jgi:glucokinase
MILAADIGGTKVNLALFHEERETLRLAKEATFISNQYSGLEDILRKFLAGSAVSRACCGVAGPVKDGICRVTNLPWIVETKKLRALLKTEAVWLINDFAAMASAVPFLEDIEVLQEGSPDIGGRIAVIGAGTGLGQAFLVPDGEGRCIIVDTEGGHCDFAPRNPVEAELLLFLLKKFDRVSIERVLSGSGLLHIYQFVNRHNSFAEPEWLTKEMRENDPAAVIAGNMSTSPACKMALEMFVALYGAVAGNLALQVMARGGVFIGGGMAPKIAGLMKGGLFMEAFLSKGRFRPFMSEVPVKMILNDKAPLLGAAHYALGKKFRR